MHSSFSRLKRFGGNAEEILDILCEQVGPEGTIAMPSFAWNIVPEKRPWVGYEQFLRSLPTFDVLNTPCNIGWLAERFRLRPGVLRSAQGIWAICATGPLAPDLTTGQELLCSPHGPGSSFWKLIQHGAKLLGLGVTLNTSSLCPVVDWELGEAHPQEVFTAAQVPIHTILLDRSRLSASAYTMSPDAVRLMNPQAMFNISEKLKSTLIFRDIEGDFFFSYPSQVYHQEAILAGRQAIERFQPMAWLSDLPLRGGTRK